MSIQVKCFEWKPGENDIEYIKLLKRHMDDWEGIAKKAISRLRTTCRPGQWNSHGRCSVCNSPYAVESWDGDITLSEQKFCYHCGAAMDMEDDGWRIIQPKS